MLSYRTRLYSLHCSDLFILIVTVLLLQLVYYRSLYTAQKYNLVYITVVGEPLYSLEVRLSMWRQQESLCTAQKYDLACSGSRRASAEPGSTTQHVAAVGKPLQSLEVRLGIQRQQESLCRAQKYDLAYSSGGKASTEPRSTTWHVAVVGEPLQSLEVRLSMSQQQQESFYIAQKYDLACRGSSRRASTRPRSTTQHTIVV